MNDRSIMMESVFGFRDNRQDMPQHETSMPSIVSPEKNLFEMSPPMFLSSESSGSGEPKQEDKKEKPKRPLSAYNLFFQHQRKSMLESMPTRPEGKPRRSHGKIGFAQLARSIAAKWKSIDTETRAYFDERAAEDKKRYVKEMDEWKKEQMREMSNVGTCMPSMSQVYFGSEMSLLDATHADILSRAYGKTASSFQESKGCATDNVDIPSSIEKLVLPGVPQMQLYQQPKIAELANKLDDDCIDLMNAIFRRY